VESLCRSCILAVRASLPYVSTGLASVLYAPSLVCLRTFTGWNTWFIILTDLLNFYNFFSMSISHLYVKLYPRQLKLFTCSKIVFSKLLSVLMVVCKLHDDITLKAGCPVQAEECISWIVRNIFSNRILWCSDTAVLVAGRSQCLIPTSKCLYPCTCVTSSSKLSLVTGYHNWDFPWLLQASSDCYFLATDRDRPA
jgi:hypothetical protein